MPARIATTALSEQLILPQGWDFQERQALLGSAAFDRIEFLLS
jgi:hypothetical protein